MRVAVIARQSSDTLGDTVYTRCLKIRPTFAFL